MGARHIGFLAMACAVFQLSCSAAAPNRGLNDASVADSTATVQRPSYNTGKGFFVRDGILYDAKGNEFRIRGVNRVHWDSDSAAGLVKSGSNTVRWDLDFRALPHSTQTW